MSRRKRVGFEKWVRYRDYDRKVEQQKLQASTLICDRLGLYLSGPKTMAFNRWRRITLMDKMKCSREVAAVEEQLDSNEPISSSSGKPSVSSMNLDTILDTFGSDVQGATYALAQEIESIKAHDIASLRQDWSAENQRLMSTMQTTLNDAIQHVNDTADTFQETISERIDSCANDLPIVHSKLEGLSNMFEGCKAHLKNIEDCHSQRIESLDEKEQQLEQRLSSVEDQAKTSAQEVTSLREGEAKSNESIQQLRDIILSLSERHEEERNLFQQALDHFGDELLKTKITLGHTRVQCETLEKELAESKSELVHFQDACQSANDATQSQIEHPGIPRPELGRLVNVGHAYEALAQEKNYVTGINVMATLRTMSTNKMKRSGEKVRTEEEVNVPSEIVAFAHDYAAWIAYQADHESLLRLIAGNNADDQVYAEDDMITRRKELCSELKFELGSLLEQASCVDSKTRGLGIRWEARAIFLSRVVSCTEAALSKHDQILLPASTRLGRVRPLSANVTVCMACDRPMRRKMARTPADGEMRQRSKSSTREIREEDGL